MKGLISAIVIGLAASQATATELTQSMDAMIEQAVTPWLDEPALIAAIKAQNKTTAGLDQAAIDTLDAAWAAEIGAAETPTIDTVVHGPLADALRAHMADANGAILEILVMDARGLNVAASGVTSDYWQGDEAKFTQTYPLGPAAMHHGEVAFDESSQAYQAQVSFTISDPKTGRPIGAMTVGLNAELLM